MSFTDDNTVVPSEIRKITNFVKNIIKIRNLQYHFYQSDFIPNCFETFSKREEGTKYFGKQNITEILVVFGMTENFGKI